MIEIEGMKFEAFDDNSPADINDVYKDVSVELNITEYQYFSFFVCGKLFAINILNIKEIIGFSKITKVPNTQNMIMGVLNTRGNILPIVDLASRFELDNNFKYGKKACIIIVEIQIEDKEVEKTIDVGIAIEEINSVLTIMPDNLFDPPSYGLVIPSKFVSKMAKIKNDFIPILNLDTILDIKDLSKRKE